MGRIGRGELGMTGLGVDGRAGSSVGAGFSGRGPGAGRSRLRRAFQVAALVVASVCFTLLASEGGLRVLGYGALHDIYSRPSILWRHDPVLGWSHEPGARDVYVGPRPWPIEFRTPVEINSMGLRGPEVEPLPSQGYRILVLGDSVVAAFEVAYASTFVALLQDDLRRALDVPVQVINAGVRGYGTDQSYLYYRERGHELEPDLVVFLHSPNDVRNNMTLHRMRRRFGKPAFAIGSEGLELRGAPVPSYPLCSNWVLDDEYAAVRLDGSRERALCWLQTRLADRSALFTFFSMRLQRHPRLLRFLYDLGAPKERSAREAGFLPLATPTSARRGGESAAYALTSEIVRALGKEVGASGSEFFLAIPLSEFDRLDAARLRSEGIVPHELSLSLPAGVDLELRFENDSHFNSRGHFYLARLLFPHLEEIAAEHLRRRRP